MAEPVRIAASFDIGRFRNAPPELVEAVAPAGSDDAPATADIVAGANDVDAHGQDPETLAAHKSFDAEPADAAPDPQSIPEPGPHVPDRNMPPSTVAAANTAPDATAIRAEAIAHARAVVDLCRLAGQPQMAGRFLEEDASLDAVRASLLDARADAEPQITPHHPQPGPNPTTRPWGDVIARTFKLKG